MKHIISVILSITIFSSLLDSPDSRNRSFFFQKAYGGMDAQDLITVSLAAIALTGLGVMIYKSTHKKKPHTYIPVILDTDMVDEAMDAGALAMLLNLDKLKTVKIQAIMTNSRSQYAPNTVKAINQFYQKTDIPIGSYKGEISTESDGKYNLSVFNQYNTGLTRANAENAVSLYRRILEKADKSSITIVSIGFLTNLYDLLKSDADEESKSSGMDLITKKVKRLVIAGGKIPTGVVYNFSYEGVGPQAIYTITNWPTEMIFAPDELGASIQTTVSPLTSNNPVKMIYEKQGNLTDKSLDQIALLYAIRGEGERFTLNSTGYMHMNEDATNLWKDDPDKNHAYLIQSQNSNLLAQEINELMQYNPGN